MLQLIVLLIIGFVVYGLVWNIEVLLWAALSIFLLFKFAMPIIFVIGLIWSAYLIIKWLLKPLSDR